MNKSNELIKRAIDSGDYQTDEKGNIYKLNHKMFVGLHKPSGRMRVRVYGVKLFLHRIVAYAKFGDKALQEGFEVHHIDNNPLNNYPSNLALVTRGYHLNTLHAGENNHAAKLKWPEINLIRRKHAEGMSMALLGRIFGVSDTTIKAIVTGTRWKNEP